jgi:hypothetical protein
LHPYSYRSLLPIVAVFYCSVSRQCPATIQQYARERTPARIVPSVPDTPLFSVRQQVLDCLNTCLKRFIVERIQWVRHAGRRCNRFAITTVEKLMRRSNAGSSIRRFERFGQHFDTAVAMLTCSRRNALGSAAGVSRLAGLKGFSTLWHVFVPSNLFTRERTHARDAWGN